MMVLKLVLTPTWLSSGSGLGQPALKAQNGTESMDSIGFQETFFEPIVVFEPVQKEALQLPATLVLARQFRTLPAVRGDRVPGKGGAGPPPIPRPPTVVVVP